MAGETVKTTALTNAQEGKAREARLNGTTYKVATDSKALLATETEVGDVLLTNIRIPSNAIVREIKVYNDDLDSNGTPTLTADVGVAAAVAFTSVTSGTKTRHAVDAVLDADLFVDGDTTLRAATTSFTSLALDAATSGPDDIDKPVWERLGYDEDPSTDLVIAVTFAAGAATGAAGDLAIQVHYLTD